MDGTLVDTVPDIHAALAHCLQAAGYDSHDQATTRHWIGFGARTLIEQALKHHAQPLPAAETQALLEVFLTHYRAHIADASQPYPHVVDTLATLRERGAKLAVITNKLTELTLPLLEGLGMTGHFDAVVCGDTTAAPKPAPDPVHYCLEQLGIGHDQSLFVGDSATDVDAARAANVTVVCVRDGYNHGVDVHTLEPDGVIDTFRELL